MAVNQGRAAALAHPVDVRQDVSPVMPTGPDGRQAIGAARVRLPLYPVGRWPDVLTSKETASYLRLSLQTVLALARDGKLPAARVGWEFRFSRPALDELLAGFARVGSPADDDATPATS